MGWDLRVITDEHPSLLPSRGSTIRQRATNPPRDPTYSSLTLLVNAARTVGQTIPPNNNLPDNKP